MYTATCSENGSAQAAAALVALRGHAQPRGSLRHDGCRIEHELEAVMMDCTARDDCVVAGRQQPAAAFA